MTSEQIATLETGVQQASSFILWLSGIAIVLFFLVEMGLFDNFGRTLSDD